MHTKWNSTKLVLNSLDFWLEWIQLAHFAGIATVKWYFCYIYFLLYFSCHTGCHVILFSVFFFRPKNRLQTRQTSIVCWVLLAHFLAVSFVFICVSNQNSQKQSQVRKKCDEENHFHHLYAFLCSFYFCRLWHQHSFIHFFTLWKRHKRKERKKCSQNLYSMRFATNFFRHISVSILLQSFVLLFTYFSVNECRVDSKLNIIVPRIFYPNTFTQKTSEWKRNKRKRLEKEIFYSFCP